MGFMWLSTVPPTNGLVVVMFGTRWLAMLTGFAFFSHQVGGFLGVLLGGIVFERTGSYDSGLVSVGVVWCALGADQSADCREARAALSRRYRPAQTHGDIQGDRR